MKDIFDLETAKAALDLGGLAVALGVLLEWMPQISALLSAAWFALRFVEWAISKNNGTKVD